MKVLQVMKSQDAADIIEICIILSSPALHSSTNVLMALWHGSNYVFL